MQGYRAPPEPQRPICEAQMEAADDLPHEALGLQMINRFRNGFSISLQ